MKSEIIKIINEIINLLNECSWQSKASWFEGKLEIIKRNDQDSIDFIATIKEIKSILAGMGSFTDLPLIPNNKSILSKNQARIKQFELAEELDSSIRSLLDRNLQ